MWHVLNRHRMQTLHIHLHGRSELVQVSNYWCPILDGFIQYLVDVSSDFEAL